MNKISCVCVNTKTGTIAIKGGIKPVFLMELANDAGEILIKFFNVNKTPKGSYSVDRNGDFAKLYRLTIGENPVARFSRCDQLLTHFIGYQFFIEYEQAHSNRIGDYLRVTSIKPEFPFLGDGWTMTGHLIRGTRKKTSKNLAISKQRNGNFLAISRQFSGNADTDAGLEPRGLERGFNPIRLFPIQDKDIPNTTLIHSNKYIEEEKPITASPPGFDLEHIEINQRFIF